MDTEILSSLSREELWLANECTTSNWIRLAVSCITLSIAYLTFMASKGSTAGYMMVFASLLMLSLAFHRYQTVKREVFHHAGSSMWDFSLWFLVACVIFIGLSAVFYRRRSS